VGDSKATLQRLGHSQQALRNGKGAGAMATVVQHWGRAQVKADEGGVPIPVWAIGRSTYPLTHTHMHAQNRGQASAGVAGGRRQRQGQDKTTPLQADEGSRAERKGMGRVDLFWGSARVRS